eukprot:763876-Rhodomonas_salina.4
MHNPLFLHPPPPFSRHPFSAAFRCFAPQLASGGVVEGGGERLAHLLRVLAHLALCPSLLRHRPTRTQAGREGEGERTREIQRDRETEEGEGGP